MIKSKKLKKFKIINHGFFKKIGVLKKGAYANFIVTSGSIFDDKTKIFENWVNGDAHVISDRKKIDIRIESFNIRENSIFYQLKKTYNNNSFPLLFVFTFFLITRGATSCAWWGRISFVLLHQAYQAEASAACVGWGRISFV